MNGDQLYKAMASIGAAGRQIGSWDNLAAGAMGALRAGDVRTPQGGAAFLATLAQESDWFRTTREYGSGQRYAPYIGRTFCQVTWKSNYAAFGKWANKRGLLADPNTFVRDPGSLSALRWAWLGGVWYFGANGLWTYANAGQFLAVSNGVNRGNPKSKTPPYGWAMRQKAYRAFLTLGSSIVPAGSPTPSKPPSSAPPVLRYGSTGARVKALQTGMRKAFPSYAGKLAVDGSYGNATRAAVKEFQRRAKAERRYGSTVDGITGPATAKALKAYGVTF